MSDGPTIEFKENGPIVVRGAASMKDSAGNEVECKPAMFLCRCGMSANKPFCDGSHSREGWTES